MRLAYVLHETLPGPTANTQQALNTLTELARVDGFELDLVVPAPAGRSPRSSRSTEISAYYGLRPDCFDGRLRLQELELPGWIRGELRKALFNVRFPSLLRSGGYDLIYVRDRLTLYAALSVGKPVVFETYRADLNSAPRYALFRWYSYRHPRLAGIVTHSKYALDSFLRAGIEPDRLLLAYNGYSPSVMQPVRTRAEARVEAGLQTDRPIVCYTGDVRARKGTDVLAEIAAEVPEALFLIVGAEPGSVQERRFLDLARRRHAANLQMVPRVPPAKVAMYLYAADVLIIPPSSQPLQRWGGTVLPIKTYLYLAAGRAIVAGDLPDTREILESDRNALLVPPDDPQAAARAIRRLLQDKLVRDRLATAAAEDARGYTWQARAERLGGFLRSRLERNRPMPDPQARPSRGAVREVQEPDGREDFYG
jgi:glycosyltransferase involved in cell wall biosynthesis